MTNEDPITAIVDQLAAHAEQLTRLDTRHADHHAAVSARLAELTSQTAALSHVVEEHSAALAQLTVPSQTNSDGYNPEPAPAWWKLAADGRQEPIARLRAWVEQVYRPGYGHLAAGLGACWPAHDLCLYALDIASERSRERLDERITCSRFARFASNSVGGGPPTRSVAKFFFTGDSALSAPLDQAIAMPLA